MQSSNAVGIDAGASLWKLFRAHEKPEMEVLPAGAVEHVQYRIARWAPDTIGVTGGNASIVAAGLSPFQCSHVNEFAAWGWGAPVLAKLGGAVLQQHYLLVSIGTGTSILEIGAGKTRRVSGSTLGGGTLLGLSRLLGCSDSYSELLTLAARGERSGVDLLVRDILPRAHELTLIGDATASSFGKLDSKEPADLAQALIWLIGENIGILCNSIAQPLSIQTMVFGGGTLAGNRILEEVLCKTLKDEGNHALFLRDSIFCGAAGAALFAGDKVQ